MDLNNKLNQIRIRDIIIIYLLSIFIVTGIVFTIIKLNHREIGDLILSALTLILHLLILIILLLRIKPSKDDILFLYYDFKKKVNRREVIEVTFVKICLAIGGSKLIISTIYFIDPSVINNFIRESTTLINSLRNYLINVVLLLVAPIMEEIIFRNIIFNRIIEKFNMWTGIVVSSIVFASFYAGSGITGAIALGVINCILYIKYNNILIPMFVSIINNIILLIWSIPIINNNIGNMIIGHNYIINIFFGSIVSLMGIFLLIKFINKNINILKAYDKNIKDKKEYSNI